jgi:hypothetical protein
MMYTIALHIDMFLAVKRSLLLCFISLPKQGKVPRGGRGEILGPSICKRWSRVGTVGAVAIAAARVSVLNVLSCVALRVACVCEALHTYL